ncbi:MAG TPA: hypothetical protein VGG15_03730, partial [Terriglobales bacterium]
AELCKTAKNSKTETKPKAKVAERPKRTRPIAKIPVAAVPESIQANETAPAGKRARPNGKMPIVVRRTRGEKVSATKLEATPPEAKPTTPVSAAQAESATVGQKALAVGA